MVTRLRRATGMDSTRRSTSLRAQSRSATTSYEDYKIPAEELKHVRRRNGGQNSVDSDSRSSGGSSRSCSPASEEVAFAANHFNGLQLLESTTPDPDASQTPEKYKESSTSTAVYVDGQDQEQRMAQLANLGQSDVSARLPDSLRSASVDRASTSSVCSKYMTRAMDASIEGSSFMTEKQTPNQQKFTSSLYSQRSTNSIRSKSENEIDLAAHGRPLEKAIPATAGFPPSSAVSPLLSGYDHTRSSLRDDRRRTLSPFASSPRSARHRRSNMSFTPANDEHNTLTQDESSIALRPIHPHPDPQKEYPLILLHCKITALPPPWPLNVEVPERMRSDFALLKRKLEGTLGTRGVLLEHPKASYRRLIAGILDTTGLIEVSTSTYSPRTMADSTSSLQAGDCAMNLLNRDATNENKKTRSNPVGSRSAHRGLPSAESDAEYWLKQYCEEELLLDQPRRWDVRVYAMSGLMGPGAWRAAWRDMERIDVEIGVWAVESQKHEWELQEVEHAAWLSTDFSRSRKSRVEDESDHRRPLRSTPGCHPDPMEAQKLHNESAMDEELEPWQVSSAGIKARATSTPKSASFGSTRRPARRRLPLTTLLGNYFRRLVSRSASIKWLLRAVVLVVIFRLGAILGSGPLEASRTTELGYTAVAGIAVAGLDATISSVNGGDMDDGSNGTAFHKDDSSRKRTGNTLSEDTNSPKHGSTQGA